MTQDTIIQIAVDDGTLIGLSSSGKVYIMNTDDREPKWKLILESPKK